MGILPALGAHNVVIGSLPERDAAPGGKKKWEGGKGHWAGESGRISLLQGSWTESPGCELGTLPLGTTSAPEIVRMLLPPHGYTQPLVSAPHPSCLFFPSLFLLPPMRAAASASLPWTWVLTTADREDSEEEGKEGLGLGVRPT